MVKHEIFQENSLPNDLVRNWFGDEFSELDPLLQKLHLSGGELSGKIEVSYGSGLSGLIGRRLANKLKLPKPGSHELLVSISHSQNGLHWNRKFNDDSVVESLFVPVGTKTDGFWVETTGPVKIKLTVDIVGGGWYWRCLKISLFGLPTPLWLFPKSQAYKTVEHGKYVFQVGFTYPFLNDLVSYKGVLDAKYSER